MRRITAISGGLVLLLATQSVLAGGYDTPILYSARHMGMGGAAIGYVDDPSALFHNPAGLSHTDLFSAIGDFSPLLGELQASPDEDDQDLMSELTFAPFFLVGASFRVTDFLTVGVAAYPVASAGAMYIYENAAQREVEDETKLVFIEIVPGVSVDIPGGVSIGVAYRATLVTFDRRQQVIGQDNSIFDISLSGQNWAGLRAGIQWQPIPWLSVGLVYRHKTETEVSADSSIILGMDFGETTMTFVLPSKIGFGVRADLGPFGAAVDVEYGLNSQNEQSTILAQNATNPDADPVELVSQFRWEDSLTLRGGVEYTFLPFLCGRLGYILDGKVSNEQYPSAFGTPPGPTHVITGGLGASLFDYVEVNLAYAYRFGSADVTAEDIDAGEERCPTCAHAGEYVIGMHGFYIDASVAF